MVKHALCLLLLLGGCFDDRYRCTSDSQCDLGEGGRCEIDGYCTQRDITCPTQRRYAAHAGELTDQCFDDRVVPVNACAGGQTPARPEGCFATVCERLPACCEVAWIDACVQLAQEACELTCDTRLAITATRGMVTERWDARLSAGQWQIDPRADLAPLVWVAPAPGTSEPRLAGATGDELVVGDTRVPVAAGRSYGSITAVPFFRDGRDTIAATYNAGSNRLEVWQLASQTASDVGVPGTPALTWGDINRDGFPDAIVRNGASQYNFLHNLETAELERRVSNQTAASVLGGGTPGAPQIRSFDWMDYNGDTALDLVVFGSEVRVHTNELGLGDAASRQLDCDPPDRMRSCSSDPDEPNLEATAFAGCALPTASDPSLVIAKFPGRKLYRVQPNGDVAPLPFPGDGCACTSTCTGGCPGPSCTCTYNCNSCVPVLALVARDVDGDHQLDLIAIDGKLQLYIGTAANNYAFADPTAIPTSIATTAFSIDVSVTGAPSP